MKYLLLFFQFLYLLANSFNIVEAQVPQTRFWQFQSIDTMKYSRDIAREKLGDASYDVDIDRQVRDIAQTGATHIAIATPYDAEFLPYLTRWVKAARKYNLHVWFRGNWSGWESWFGYPSISREEHIRKTQEFIVANPQLFADGDIFSACPECENGGSGDPRHSGDVTKYRQFLIAEYTTSKQAFTKINKKVSANYYSMNADVAKLVMDRDTTSQLDGIVVIDHYVKTVQQLDSDITQIASASGGQVVLGEFGVPIPDIHGKLTSAQQAEWLGQAMPLLVANTHLVGLNYWLNIGGSTALWSGNGQAYTAVQTLTSFYTPPTTSLKFVNDLKLPVTQGQVKYLNREYKFNSSGIVVLPKLAGVTAAIVTSPDYKNQTLDLSTVTPDQPIILNRLHEDIFFKLWKLLSNLTLKPKPGL